MTINHQMKTIIKILTNSEDEDTVHKEKTVLNIRSDIVVEGLQASAVHHRSKCHFPSRYCCVV